MIRIFPKNKIGILFTILLLSVATCSARNDASDTNSARVALEAELNDYIYRHNGKIGVAVIIDGTDTISVNGNNYFPMMSVFKFPLALAVADYCDSATGDLTESINFSINDLKEDTYSPMLKKYGKKYTSMQIRELLEWSLIESDNNAADILMKKLGGATEISNRLSNLGVSENIIIEVSEDEMHSDISLANKNRATPLALAELFDMFRIKLSNKSGSFREVSDMLMRCKTGEHRLAQPLTESNVIIAHKTGTGFETQSGGISAVNDCGYVIFPDGKGYSITVLVADDKLTLTEGEKIIADISEIVFKRVRTYYILLSQHKI